MSSGHTEDVAFDVASASIGFPPPPFGVQLRPVPGSATWSISLGEGSGHLGELVSWLETWRPKRVLVEDDETVRADLASAPAMLSWLPRNVDVASLAITREGAATLVVRGRDAAVRRFERMLRDSGARVASHRLPGRRPRVRPFLTPGQEEALRAAVEHGYYAVPRRASLRAIAQSLGVSASSLSERLRRAEARLVMRHVQGADAPNL